MILGLVVAGLVIVFDQLSKYYILHHFLGLNSYITFGDYFNVVRAWNTGVSFSMFNNYGNIGVYILSGVAIIVVLALLKWLKSETGKLVQVALGMIMGGAIGNVIDRLRLGAVFDFLDFHIGDNHWPAFNVADSFICIGAGIIILSALISKFEKRGA
ncbi:MAG: signal peptidase II [Alphaproteobacteria bacterium]|nr:signal peptidase II [Alphaproteobacteria bacterium]